MWKNIKNVHVKTQLLYNNFMLKHKNVGCYVACRNGNNFMCIRSYFKSSLKWQNVKRAEKPGSVTWLPALVCLDPLAASLDGDCPRRRNTGFLPAHVQDIDPHQQIHGQRGQHQLLLQRHGAAGWMHPSFDHGNTTWFSIWALPGWSHWSMSNIRC